MIRIEGKNGSGKTLFLEVLAEMFYLKPEEIKDESLRDYYTGFLNQDQKQKIKFSVAMEQENLQIVSSKNADELQPSVKINNERKTANYLRDKFHVYFDSIKSPKDQAKEYKAECERQIESLEEIVDAFYTYISSLESKISDYLNAKDEIDKRKKMLENAKKKLEKLGTEIPNINEELEHLKTLQSIKKVLDGKKDVDELTAILEKIKQKVKEQKSSVKEVESTTRELTDAYTAYMSLINRLDKTDMSKVLPNDCEFLFKLKPNSSLKELEEARQNLARIKANFSIKSNKIKGSKEYEKLEFINSLRQFILENKTKFLQTYPDFYKKIEDDYKNLTRLEQEDRKLDALLSTIIGIDTTVNTYVKVLNKNKVNPIYINYGDEGGWERQQAEFEERIKNLTVEYKKEEAKLGLVDEKLVMEANKCGKDELAIKIEQKSKDKSIKDEEKVDAEADKRTAIRLIEENEAIIKSPPKYATDIKNIQKIKEQVEISIKRIGEVKSVINKIRDNKTQDFTSQDERIAKNIGKFFGQYQIDILHDYKVRKVAEIDLIKGEYILEDGIVVNFRSNSGKILVNTLLARIRNLPSNKKSVLLIDEVSPLDSDNINLLQKEIGKEIDSGKVLFAAIAIPGENYSDKELHVVEVQ